MLAALIIVFREVLEAGLIVGIVLAATRGVGRSRAWVAGGIAAGIAGSAVVAAFTGAIASAFAGVGQEMFNALVLALAAVMLTVHNVWMARHGRQLASEMREAGEQVRTGARSLAALAAVVGLAVLREGSEVVLFLYGVITAGGSTVLDLVGGSLLGVAAGAAISALTFLGLLVLPIRYLFVTTSAMITFLAAGMAAQSVVFLEQAGLSTAFTGIAWDTSGFISESSWLGRVLHTLIGYSDQPSEMQVIVYVFTLACIFALMWLFSPRRRPRAVAV
ncbi:MAG: FTR1 family protein [Hyphomicrobiales bacterium]